jgi:hypothetical protein
MSYSAYLRGGQFLSLMDEDAGVWLHLTESQRHTLHVLSHGRESASAYSSISQWTAWRQRRRI